jgi:hypothetical protein
MVVLLQWAQQGQGVVSTSWALLDRLDGRREQKEA